jgi:hypothetical protein
VAQDQGENSQPQNQDPGDRQLRSLISLFNWLVGEVITARIMILRLAGDLVRSGVLTVDEINGAPLTQEIIDSVLSNFPQDPMWQALGQRLRGSLDSLRKLDLENDLDRFDDDLDDDDLDDDLDDDDDEEIAEDPSQVIYKNPEHDDPIPRQSLFPRLSKTPAKQN